VISRTSTLTDLISTNGQCIVMCQKKSHKLCGYWIPAPLRYRPTSLPWPTRRKTVDRRETPTYYESDWKEDSFLYRSGPAKNLQNGLLTGCSRNFDPIFDPIIIAKCSQMVTVGHIGGGIWAGKLHIVVQQGLFRLSGMFWSWGAGAGGMSSTSQEDFPIRQVVPVGLGFSFWVCLGWF